MCWKPFLKILVVQTVATAISAASFFYASVYKSENKLFTQIEIKMEKEIIAPLEKTKITKDLNKNNDSSSGCCGGTPTNNADACCKLDEEKKADGEEGCGCSTSDNGNSKSSCC